ncbi:MAG: class I SAM-dependent methyltransferase [Bacteroidales bacterium]|nr:class I SAM-dependent methyltransferase [Bacteroidales bacterium]
MKYTFGHTTLAAERLRRIAEFFNPYSSRFILSGVNDKIISACDMGCGPGYSTEMLYEATKANSITGLDFSEDFICIAKEKYNDFIFQKQDVTKNLGVHKYDLIYSRFLLSHIPDISSAINTWKNSLTKNGKIFIDELEDINTEVPVFKKYLQISGSLVKSQDAELFVGKKMDSAIKSYNVENNYSEVIKVPDRQASAWFYPNAAGIWSESEVVNNIIGRSEILQIQKKLLELMDNESKESRITWKMKRIIIFNKITKP